MFSVNWLWSEPRSEALGCFLRSARLDISFRDGWGGFALRWLSSSSLLSCVHFNLCAVWQRIVPFDDYCLTLLQSGNDLYFVRGANADYNFSLVGCGTGINDHHRSLS